MKAFILTSYIIALLLCACNSGEKKNEATSKLKNQKYSIDSAINAGALQLFVKIKGKPGLLEAKDSRNKTNVEAAYNVFRDKSGKVVYIAELPFSPKDDWFISYKSYFGADGKLLAFQAQNNFFGSECAKGAAMENLVKYYNADFTVADSSYTLTDTKKNPLDKSKCKFPYTFPYKVNRSLEEFKKDRGITNF